MAQTIYSPHRITNQACENYGTPGVFWEMFIDIIGFFAKKSIFKFLEEKG